MSDFELQDVVPADLDDMAAINDVAWASWVVWRLLFAGEEDGGRGKGVPEAERRAWLAKLMGKMFEGSGVKGWKIVEKSSGRLVAYTRLAYPTKQPTEEQSGENASPPAGCDEALYKDFMAKIGCAKKYGYNPETDFHRKGTCVLPEFQKLGLGKRLTQHCNAISDAAGRPTYVVAMSNSQRLFHNTGFQTLADEPIDLSELGGGDGMMYAMKRDPVVPA